MTCYTYEQLEGKIQELIDGKILNSENEPYDFRKEIYEERFMAAEFPELVNNFYGNQKDRRKGECEKGVQRHSQQYWHAFVREVNWPPEELQFLREDLCRLILRYRNSFKDYFKLNSKENFVLPDRLDELTRLQILFKDFFDIYRNIIHNIHFENPIERNFQKNIDGKVNWQKTIQISKTEFPTQFLMEKRKREFQHPGNVLLILCLKWQQNLAKKFLEIEFEEQLMEKEHEIIQTIILKTKNGLLNFPFSDVINEVSKYEHFENNHYLIKKLEKQLQIELKQKIITNFQYQKLLDWIEKFRTIDFTELSSKTSNFNLDLIKSIDFAYEGWVFWKIIEKFNQKHYFSNLVINQDEGYFEFLYKDKRIKFYHERYGSGRNNGKPNGNIVGWQGQHDPDFTVYVEPFDELDDLVCVFDAKNTKSIGKRERTVTSVYRDDLHCNLSGIIFNANQKVKEIKKLEYNEKKSTYHAIRASPGFTTKNDEGLEDLYQEVIGRIDFKINIKN